MSARAPRKARKRLKYRPLAVRFTARLLARLRVPLSGRFRWISRRGTKMVSA